MTDQQDVRAATLAGAAGERRSRRAQWLRRGALMFLALILVVAVSGVLDREVTVTARAETGESVEMTHERLARPGTDVTVTVAVHSDAPTVTLEVPQVLFEELGIDALWPEPASHEAHGSLMRLVYPNPTGQVTFEAVGRLGTTESPGARSYTLRLLEPELELDLRMWVLP